MHCVNEAMNLHFTSRTAWMNDVEQRSSSIQVAKTSFKQLLFRYLDRFRYFPRKFLFICACEGFDVVVYEEDDKSRGRSEIERINVVLLLKFLTAN